MKETKHTVKPELKDIYEPVVPIPKLNLPELIENACVKPKDNDFEYIIHVSPVSKRNQACDECGSISYHGDGKSKDRKVQDISMGLVRVTLQVEVPRYKCLDCGHKFSHRFECIVPGMGFTHRLLQQIQCRAFQEPFSRLAEEYGVSVPTISHIMAETGRALDEEHPLIAPRVLGIDEKHIEHKMRAVYVDIENGILLEMSPDNKKETVKNLIRSMKGWENIEVVTTDMAQGYRPAIEELLPNAKLVIDKYHVIQQLSQATTKVRTRLTELSHEEVAAMPEGDTKAIRKSILVRAGKDSYLFKFNEKNVADNSKRLSLMAELCEYFPNFNTLRLLKDGFANIYKNTDPTDAKRDYEAWKSLLKCADKNIFAEFKSFGRTVSRWEKEIFQYFEPECRFTNAASEGLNSLIQAINSQGRGYGFEALRLKALYQKHASLPKRTIKEVSLVYGTSYMMMNMMTSFDSPVHKKVKARTVIPRGAYIDKLLDLSENGELFR